MSPRMVSLESVQGDVIRESTKEMRVVERAKVLIIDDHPLLRQGLEQVLAIDPLLQVVGSVGSASDALAVARRVDIDVAIIDLLLPTMSGSALAAMLVQLQPQCKVLGLSSLDQPTRIAEMLRAGARGFALKSEAPAEIAVAIRTILRGEQYLSPGLPVEQIRELIRSDAAWPLQRLTARERQIFELLVSGHSNDDIATMLAIARRTVETHRQHIMKKVGARSLVELVRLGLKHGYATLHS